MCGSEIRTRVPGWLRYEISTFSLLYPNGHNVQPTRQHSSVRFAQIISLAQAHWVQHISSSVFLLHIAMEAPLAMQGIWAPHTLPFLQLNNTTVVVLKVRWNIRK
jgi:hypothetical protein